MTELNLNELRPDLDLQNGLIPGSVIRLPTCLGAVAWLGVKSQTELYQRLRDGLKKQSSDNYGQRFMESVSRDIGVVEQGLTTAQLDYSPAEVMAAIVRRFQGLGMVTGDGIDIGFLRKQAKLAAEVLNLGLIESDQYQLFRQFSECYAGAYGIKFAMSKK